jgi:beta-lactam-binding protein with PASTA domain
MQRLRCLLQACAVGLCACVAGLLDAHALTFDAPPDAAPLPDRTRRVLDPKVVPVARVPVRNFIGKSYREAEAGLARDTLKMALQWKPSSKPQGEVIAQDPSQGEVFRRSIVRVDASDGSLVRVPALRGQSAVAAEATTAPVDQAETRPSPPALVSVPDVLGADEYAARARLGRAGLRAARREFPSEQGPAGSVIAQEPRAGANVERGSEVRILVATAAVPSLVWVPSFVGQPEEVARKGLQDAGRPEMRSTLRVRTELRASSAPAQYVVAQDPMNQKVPRGATVTLILSDGSLVHVPDVQGRDEVAARDAVQAAGLGVLRTEQPSDQHAPGSVMAQEPRARQEVRRGSSVTITIATALTSPSSGTNPGGAANAGRPGGSPPGTTTPPATGPATTAATTVAKQGWIAAWRDAPGLWFAAGVVSTALAAWLLNRRPRPIPASPDPQPATADPKPDVRVEWTGPSEQARLSSHEGEPVRLTITVSPVHAAERPSAHVSDHEEEVLHG